MIEYHRPVLLEECLEGLNIKPEGIYVDVTFGGGGHSKEILKRLSSGKLVAFDQDEDAQQNIPDSPNLIFVQHNFRFLNNFLRYHQIEQVDGLLADLGVSSHHFDTAQRGFSFRFDSAIDMRMNMSSDFSAKDVLNTYDEAKLRKLFREYGELKNAGKLASRIVKARMANSIVSTRGLLEAIQDCLPAKNENQYLAKVFQALRIEVNHEVDFLKEMLQQAAEALKPGGRIVIISYHSLEDRLVKNFMKWGRFDSNVETDIYGNYSCPLKPVNAKVIIPSEEEIKLNSRARSAKLRIAEKI